MLPTEDAEAEAIERARGRIEYAVREAVRIGYRAGVQEGITRLDMLSAMQQPKSFTALQHFCGTAAEELKKKLEAIDET